MERYGKMCRYAYKMYTLHTQETPRKGILRFLEFTKKKTTNTLESYLPDLQPQKHFECSMIQGLEDPKQQKCRVRSKEQELSYPELQMLKRLY